MKYLNVFLLFISTHLSAQSIDCQLLDKISKASINQKKAMRTKTVSIMANGVTESVTEIDTARNFRTIITLPPKTDKGLGERISRMETRGIKGIQYTKSNVDKVWTYKTGPVIDTNNIKKLAESMAHENCQKVGSEIIDGTGYDIIGADFRMKSLGNQSMHLRYWVNLKDSSIRKSEMNIDASDQISITTVTEYGIVIASIEKPQDAIAEKPNPNARKTPEYKDGNMALYTFMASKLVYPKTASDTKIEGTVFVKFMVEADGSVCDISITKGIDPDCDKAAIDLVTKTSGNWLPALSFGVPVKASYTMPVRFKL